LDLLYSAFPDERLNIQSAFGGNYFKALTVIYSRFVIPSSAQAGAETTAKSP